MKSKHHKRLIISAIVAVCLLICGLLVYINIPRTSFDMKPDSDTSFYGSNEYSYSSLGLRNENHLSYYNGRLCARDFNSQRITAFTPDSNNSFSVPKDACMVNDKLYYIENDSLICEDTKSGEKVTIDNNCRYFVLDDKTIVYSKDKSIIAKDLNSFETKGEIKVENEVFYFNIVDNNMYLIETDLKFGYDPYKTADTYTFCKYDTNGLKLIKSKSVKFHNPLEHIAICKDSFYYYYPDTESIHRLSLYDDTLFTPIKNKDVTDIVSNNENVFFVSEKTESAIIRRTVECESNGVWIINNDSGRVSKISDKCGFTDLLATESFVYCYKPEYTFPRGTADAFVKGFTIEQIPI